MTMTLEQVRCHHRDVSKRCRDHIKRNGDRCPRETYDEIASMHDAMADAIDAHLASAAKVPDAMTVGLADSHEDGYYRMGWNACREAMLSARGEGEK